MAVVGAPTLTDLGLADDAADRSAAVAFGALAASAAAVHLAVAPPHVDDSMVLGLGFVAAAWAQLATAWLGVTRPSRRLWTAAAVLHIALLGAWAISRTAGLPFGEHAGHPEDVTIVDATAVALEVVASVLALRLVLARGIGIGRALGVGVPVLAVAAASVAIASPDARTHAHGGHAGGAMAQGHHEDGAGTALASIQERGFGTFMNGHEHSHVEVVLDPATQAELDRQLAITADLAAQFPTMQHAIDAGYRRAGPYVPGLGIHLVKFAGAEYLNPDGVMDDADLRAPLSLLYSSEHRDAELGGYMYYAATRTEPEGFPGRNDGWHYHENLCAVASPDGLLDFPFGPDHAATKAQCDGVGGHLMDSQWMIHVWTVPGWDDMADYGGVFAEMHPGFGCSDGTWSSIPFEQWGANPLNTCASGASGQPALE